MRCPHGDATCPCQDGDACHYEWTRSRDAMPCPTMTTRHLWPDFPGPPFGVATHHCHVEGCRWGAGGDDHFCGLLRIAPQTPVMAAYALGCGAIRCEMHLSR